MWSRCTRIEAMLSRSECSTACYARPSWFWHWLAVALLLGVGAGAAAQSIESILAPGKLIQAHAKVEDDCKQCHVKFDRAAQSRLCQDCHKEVGADVRAKTGFHGRLKPQPCNSCHTDHKGRDAQIVNLDRQRFDHAQTDFLLRGKHTSVACEKCHVSGKKFSEASMQCSVCHRKDDTHKGALGTQCADCHTEGSWKEAKFDHSKTKFPLEGRHADVKCASCHRDHNYKETARACVACHRKDDDAKGHNGQFGDKCETCHGVVHWKPATFRHDVDTKYPLRGKHVGVACSKCHSGPLYRAKPAQDCASCHGKDDKHQGTLGKDCVSCHSERSWKEPAKFDHDRSSFPLVGKHASVECKGCHKSALFKEAPRECLGCHKKDDKHQGNLGEACAQCHGAVDWKNTQGRFSHERTRFALRGAHAVATVKCTACHADLTRFRGTAMECVTCHKKDDKHEAQLGTQCAQCHGDANWKAPQFDHRRARFVLTGRHITTECKLCHLTPRYRDAARECVGCHQKDDRHKLKFGERCESCHSTRSWTLWDFDHDKRSKYRLEAGHRRVACESCHRLPAGKNETVAPLGTNCISCHRSDDIHDGQFGVRCEQCHSAEGWKSFVRRTGQSILPQRLGLGQRAGTWWTDLHPGVQT